MRSQAKKRRLSPVVLAMVIWLTLGLAAPLLVHLTSSSLPFKSAVVAAQTTSYTLARPVALGGGKLVIVEGGTIQLADANGKPIGSSKADALLASGAGTLVLDHAELSIADPKAAVGEADLPQAPIAEALASLRAESLILKRSTVEVTLPNGQVETLSGVDATVALKRKGLAVIRGKGTLRGQRVTFDVTSGLQLDRRAAGPETVPLRAQIRSPLLEFTFDGRMAVGEQLHMEGQGDILLSSVRQVARWLGAYWPPGPGLKVVSVKGQLAWTDRSLSFNRATVRVDGNEANGTLDLVHAQSRPLLAGTLAFNTLDLSPFLRDRSEPSDAALSSWSALTATIFSAPLGGLLDADVRLSAEKVLLDNSNLGSSAATIALKDGRLLADIAELQIGSGRGAVQIGADLTAFKPRLSLRGKLDNVDLSRLIKVGDNRALLQAPGSIVLDLTGSGSTSDDLLRSITGRIGIRSLEPGRIGLDLKRAAGASIGTQIDGWAPLTRGALAFDSADIKLIARDGVLLTEQVEVRNSEGLWTATGLVNVPAGRVDLRLMNVLNGQRNAQPKTLEVRGPWAQPTIRPIPDPGSSASAPDALEPG